MKKKCLFLLMALSSGVLMAVNGSAQDDTSVDPSQGTDDSSALVTDTGSDASSLASGDTPAAPLVRVPDLHFSMVAQAGNKEDPSTHLGSVSYVYGISECDVTVQEYSDFLNATAKTGDPYHLYNIGMSDNPAVASIICTVDSNGVYSYTPMTGREEVPITCLSIYAAARYCNWLQNGQLSTQEMPNVTETGSYYLNGATSGALIRMAGAQYVLPNENEWYKAAFFSPDGTYYAFPNRSNWSPYSTHNMKMPYNNEANYNHAASEEGFCLTPVGSFYSSMSPWGTWDMGGNVNQWTETASATDPAAFIVKGGSWKSPYLGPLSNDLGSSSRVMAYGGTGREDVGFRIVKLGASDSSATSQSAIPDSSWASPTQLAWGAGAAAVLVSGGTLYKCYRPVAAVAAGTEEGKIVTGSVAPSWLTACRNWEWNDLNPLKYCSSGSFAACRNWEWNDLNPLKYCYSSNKASDAASEALKAEALETSGVQVENDSKVVPTAENKSKSQNVFMRLFGSGGDGQ